ncbi:MAG: Uma2 family endonuclease [Chloroflexaceae bacterium]|nr:Uma2 family endonuclease [Chloroflexaceae bacterium]
MTTTLDRPVETGATTQAEDPFRYGWRYVRRELSDGNVMTEQIPLTLEDVLHPQEGDQVTHSDAHQRRCVYLFNVFSACVRNDPSAVVLHDVRIAWDVPELKAHGPDLMVMFGVRERQNWSTFDVAAEGVRPALIVEVTSPETSDIDRSTKLEEYDVATVPLYIIVDTIRRRGQTFLRLLGYRQAEVAYEALPPDERGWLWIEPLRLWMGVQDNELFCYDEDGVQIGTYNDVVEALESERETLATEREMLAAEREALAAERAARAEAEAQAAREQAARAEAEAQAAREQTARAEAETRLRELEAELRRLRGEP